ncbi:ferritin-like domain-containing protein [Aliarcobacter lanthieri]|uniref:ferritin-like domain-containing protein n=1 Tax=Aliarcobacter lanthieri TaxID=1355374 RepID=UPI003AAB4F30
MAIDYNILTNKKVDPISDIPVRDQILQIAVYDEFEAYETYSKIIEKFGNITPFINIKEAEAVHYSVLIQLMQKYNIEVPINDFSTTIIDIPNTIIECCELGVAEEINNISMYNNLLSFAVDSDIIDVLFKLQAASYNNHLPAFRNCVFNHYNNGTTSGINQDDIMQRMQEYQEILNNVMNGNIDEGLISSLFSKLNMSMVGGMVSGGAIIALLNNFLTQNSKDEE